jgi:hypothetical protein
MEDEVFSDVEGEDPYYPETERTYVTTTRSGRSVYTPKRLIVEEYEEVSSDSEGPSSIDTQSTDATFTDTPSDDDSPTTDVSESEEEEEEEEGEEEGKEEGAAAAAVAEALEGVTVGGDG